MNEENEWEDIPDGEPTSAEEELLLDNGWEDTPQDDPNYIDPETNEVTDYKYLADEALVVDSVVEKEAPYNIQDRKDKLERLKIEKEIKALEFDEETLSTGNRVLAGIGGFQGQLRENVLAPLAKFFGADEEAKNIKSDGLRQQVISDRIAEEYTKKYGEDAWNIAQTTGELVPELAVAIASGAKNSVQAVAEAGVTYAKTGSVGEAITAGGLSFVGGRLIDKIMGVGVKGTKTAFGKEIDKLETDQKEAIINTLDVLESNGIDEMGEAGRKKLIEKIDFTKSTEQISTQVKTELKALEAKSKKVYDDSYSRASKIAETTDSADVSDILESLKRGRGGKGKVDVPTKKGADTDAYDAYSKAKKVLTSNSTPNAQEIEDSIRLLKSHQREATGTTKHYFDTAIDGLQKKQDELLEGIDKPNLYKESRELWKQHQREFTGSIDGKGSGAKIKDTLTNDKGFNIATDILSNGLTADTAQDLAKAGLSKQVRSDMVKDMMTKGIDVEDIGRLDVMDKVLTKWKSFDKDGLKAMLGNNYKKVKSEMEALSNLQDTVKFLSKNNKGEGYAKDLENLATYSALSGISPFFAGKGVITTVKRMMTKSQAKNTKGKLMKRFKEVKDAGLRNRLIKSLSSVTIGNAVVGVTEGD